MQHCFCSQYTHRYIQTQALCFTNVLLRSQCTAKHDYHSTSRCLSIHYIEKVLHIQVGIRKKFLDERADWCKKQHMSLGILCKGNSRGYAVHQRAMTTSEQWVLTFIWYTRNTAPSTNWPFFAQASLFSKDMIRHPLLSTSGATKDVTALRHMWLSSSWGYSIIGEGSHECIFTFFSAKIAKRDEAMFWEEILGAWQHIWLLQQLGTRSCG